MVPFEMLMFNGLFYMKEKGHQGISTVPVCEAPDICKTENRVSSELLSHGRATYREGARGWAGVW